MPTASRRTKFNGVFTTSQAARFCRVSLNTIIRCFDSGRLKGFRVPGSRFRRITAKDLLDFMREGDVPTDLLFEEYPELAGKRSIAILPKANGR